MLYVCNDVLSFLSSVIIIITIIFIFFSKSVLFHSLINGGKLQNTAIVTLQFL